MTRLISLLLAFAAVAALSGCKTTDNQGYTGNNGHQPGVSDGVKWRDPGRANRVRNAFSTFMY